MKNKLEAHVADLSQVRLEHRVTSDEMVNEHWVTMLPEANRERWIQDKAPSTGDTLCVPSRHFWMSKQEQREQARLLLLKMHRQIYDARMFTIMIS